MKAISIALFLSMSLTANAQSLNVKTCLGGDDQKLDLLINDEGRLLEANLRQDEGSSKMYCRSHMDGYSCTGRGYSAFIFQDEDTATAVVSSSEGNEKFSCPSITDEAPNFDFPIY